MTSRHLAGNPDQSDHSAFSERSLEASVRETVLPQIESLNKDKAVNLGQAPPLGRVSSESGVALSVRGDTIARDTMHCLLKTNTP